LPGGGPIGASLHIARTVCRRAERMAVKLSQEEDIGEIPVKFLNRLSDLLFVLARAVNLNQGIKDAVWTLKNKLL
ncbi:MAG TPA: ATP:cob(I)alamin adenosyltransferase, partial [Patescibacteria group bacterium]|nr:ATP:cob(I)alamin adenosyltransferase [Patescibacteria group bacterium]